MAKSRKPFSLQLKRPKFCHFLGLKAVWRKNYDYKPQFFLEIRKALCLSVNLVPKLIQNLFSKNEAKNSSTLWDWDHCKCFQCLIITIQFFSGAFRPIFNQVKNGFPIVFSNLVRKGSGFFFKAWKLFFCQMATY